MQVDNTRDGRRPVYHTDRSPACLYSIPSQEFIRAAGLVGMTRNCRLKLLLFIAYYFVYGALAIYYNLGGCNVWQIEIFEMASKSPRWLPRARDKRSFVYYNILTPVALAYKCN